MTKKDLDQISQLLDNSLNPIQKDIKGIKSDITVLQKDFRVMLAVFDRAGVERLEEHLGLSKN